MIDLPFGLLIWEDTFCSDKVGEWEGLAIELIDEKFMIGDCALKREGMVGLETEIGINLSPIEVINRFLERVVS